ESVSRRTDERNSSGTDPGPLDARSRPGRTENRWSPPASPWSDGPMSDLRITDVDLNREDEILAWNALLGEGFNAGREAAWWASDETMLAQYGDPKPGRTSVLLVATLDGRAVGAAGADVDPGEAADVEISVLPGERRQGIGTALAAGVRERLRGAAEILQAETYSEAGVA